MVLWLVERFTVFSHMIRLLSGARGRKIQEPGEKIPLSEEEKNGFFLKNSICIGTKLIIECMSTFFRAVL